MQQNLITLKDAAQWASEYLNKSVSINNISYLINYGKIRKFNNGDKVRVDIEELKNYYDTHHAVRRISWNNKLGKDLNWDLSFENLREIHTTKHVHRLHPYKGKFIPQLVEYFLDNHKDKFKKEVFFAPNDIILDPFMGSGTMLVQANELGIHSVGVDISEFNCLISEVKMQKYDLNLLDEVLKKIIKTIKEFEKNINLVSFENELDSTISIFNKKYFPSPEYKFQIARGEIDEVTYAFKKEKEFLDSYQSLLKNYGINNSVIMNGSFLSKWYTKYMREEINAIKDQVMKITNEPCRKLFMVILSRTIRSCRATTHSDLATLKEPQLTTYYCYKHRKICKPLFSIEDMFKKYARDSIERVNYFAKLRNPNTLYAILSGDSRTIDLYKETNKNNQKLAQLIKTQGIKGIFSSPPYVGQIDYHEQHAYAYDLYGMERKDSSEIGPLYMGKGQKAKDSYVKGISDVLLNIKKYLSNDYNVFLVANDKFNLYPLIAKISGMKIVNQFERPVLNRTERDTNPYSEVIFHLKKN